MGIPWSHNPYPTSRKQVRWNKTSDIPSGGLSWNRSSGTLPERCPTPSDMARLPSQDLESWGDKPWGERQAWHLLAYHASGDWVAGQCQIPHVGV